MAPAIVSKRGFLALVLWVLNRRNGCRVIIRIETSDSVAGTVFYLGFASVKYVSLRPHPRAKIWHTIWLTGLNPVIKSLGTADKRPQNKAEQTRVPISWDVLCINTHFLAGSYRGLRYICTDGELVTLLQDVNCKSQCGGFGQRTLWGQIWQTSHSIFAPNWVARCIENWWCGIGNSGSPRHVCKIQGFSHERWYSNF